MKEIVLADRSSIVLVDSEDFVELDRYNWRLMRSAHGCYAGRSPTKEERSIGYPTKVKMHRQMLGLITDTSIRIDHRNGNTLDNRRSNLRIATNSENMMNVAKRRTETSSIYKGVSWAKRYKKWRASIGYNYKVYNLGVYDSEREAAEAYNRKAGELFGEFAYLNTIKDI